MDYEKFISEFSEKYIVIEKDALEKILEKIEEKMDKMKNEILEEVKKNNVLSNGELEIESG